MKFTKITLMKQVAYFFVVSLFISTTVTVPRVVVATTDLVSTTSASTTVATTTGLSQAVFQLLVIPELVPPAVTMNPTLQYGLQGGSVMASSCAPVLTSYTRVGMTSSDVTKLQNFLNVFFSAGLVQNGHFDVTTQSAVQRFQSMYGIPQTGNQYVLTTHMINRINCDFGSPLPPATAVSSQSAMCTVAFENSVAPLRYSQGNAQLQVFLNVYEHARLPVTGYFGPRTAGALKAFTKRENVNASADSVPELLAHYCGTGARSGASVAPLSYWNRGLLTAGVAQSTKTPLATVDATDSKEFIDVTSPKVVPATSSSDYALVATVTTRSFSSFFKGRFPWWLIIIGLLGALAILVSRYLSDMSNSSLGMITPTSSKPVIAVDDLQKIEGIGPAIEKVLRSAGITSFAKLADMKADALKAIVTKTWPHFNDPNIATWAEQSMLARDGKWDEFKKLVRELENGVHK